MRGDIHFFHGGTGIGDRLIMWRTKSKYSHCEVEVEDGVLVGATVQGVVKHTVDDAHLGRNIDVWHSDLVAQSPHLGDACHFVELQVGSRYGWADIANQLLTFLGFKIFLASPESFDCSDLVVRFLDLADFDLPDTLKLNPELVTPGDLAKALGLEK